MPENDSPSVDPQKKGDAPAQGSAASDGGGGKPDGAEGGGGKPKRRQSEIARSLHAKKEKSKGRRLSDDQRKALWKKAVIAKARSLKHISEGVIIAFLLIELAIHALPFVKYEGQGKTWTRRGYQIATDLVTSKTVTRYVKEFESFFDPETEKHEVETLGTFPHVKYLTVKKTGEIAVKDGKRVGRFDAERPATFVARLYLLIPIGAVLLLVLYLLDYVLWMGRALPALSFVYGFGSVAYLMATRIPAQGTWNAFGSFMPWWTWFLVWLPLFFIGMFSMLRGIVSHRYKRYQFRGLPVPEHLMPPKKAAPGAEAKAAKAAQSAEAKE
jgi:hypothetical protein